MRSKYIYFVRIRLSGALLGVFTVKHEAHTWAKRWCGEHYLLDRLQLSRMRDGIHHEKKEEPIDWDQTGDTP